MAQLLTRKLILISPILAAVAMPVQLSAQAETTASPLANDGGSVCMARPMKKVAQVPVSKRGQLFRVVTVERGVQALEQKGFQRVDCEAADLARVEKRGAWRDEICELASTGNEAVQIQLARAYGEKPAVLCAAAEQVAGQWERKKRKPKPPARE